MRNNYLIPANSKKSQLILNAFRGVDLMVMGAGAFLTLALMFIIPGDGLIEEGKTTIEINDFENVVFKRF